jgi:probable HAF family extracellular repeat protein
MKRILRRTSFLAICCAFIALQPTLGASLPRYVPIGAVRATGISADGSIVAGGTTNGAFLWTEAGGLEDLPLPSGHRLFEVTNLSGDGTAIVGGLVIGRGLDQRYEGFRWTRAEGFRPLGRFSTDFVDWAFATDVSYDGSVVVGTNDSDDGRRAFRWTESTGQVDLGTLGTMNPNYSAFSEGEAV